MSAVKHQGRSAWTDRVVKPPTQRARRRGVAVHWPGDGVLSINSHADCLRYLRGWEAFHINGRGWSSIAYNQAACPHGYLIDGRGVLAQSGANGNAPANSTYGSVLAIISPGEAPNAPMLAAIAAALDDQAPGGLLTTHNAVRVEYGLGPTACPGPHLTRWVQTHHHPAAPATTPSEGDDMPSVQDIWTWRVETNDHTGTGKDNTRSAEEMLAQTHRRAGEARQNSAAALNQANRNRDALAALAEGLAPEIASHVVELLGDKVEVRLSVEGADGPS